MCEACQEAEAVEDGLCPACMAARAQHDINMTDNPRYAQAPRESQRERDLDQYGEGAW